jgi:hypothetical protein
MGPAPTFSHSLDDGHAFELRTTVLGGGEREYSNRTTAYFQRYQEYQEYKEYLEYLKLTNLDDTLGEDLHFGKTPHTAAKQAISLPIGHVEPEKDRLSSSYVAPSAYSISGYAISGLAVIGLSLKQTKKLQRSHPTSLGVAIAAAVWGVWGVVACLVPFERSTVLYGSLLAGAATCLSLMVVQHVEEVNRSKAKQFVGELMKQESKVGRNGRASKNRRARTASGGSMSPRPRREGSGTAAAAAKRAAADELAAGEKVAAEKAKRSAAEKTPAVKRAVTKLTVAKPAKGPVQASPTIEEQADKQCCAINATCANTTSELKQPLCPSSSSSISESGNDSKQAELCVVCLDIQCSHAFVPCGHLCVCLSCADMVMENDSKECPMCRATSQSVMRVYTL